MFPFCATVTFAQSSFALLKCCYAEAPTGEYHTCDSLVARACGCASRSAWTLGVEVEAAHGRGPLLSVANGGRRTRLGKKDKGGKKNQEDGTRCVL